MATILFFGFLTACNIMGVTWLSNSTEMSKKGEVRVQTVYEDEALKSNYKA